MSMMRARSTVEMVRLAGHASVDASMAWCMAVRHPERLTGTCGIVELLSMCSASSLQGMGEVRGSAVFSAADSSDAGEQAPLKPHCSADLRFSVSTKASPSLISAAASEDVILELSREGDLWRRESGEGSWLRSPSRSQKDWVDCGRCCAPGFGLESGNMTTCTKPLRQLSLSHCSTFARRRRTIGPTEHSWSSSLGIVFAILLKVAITLKIAEAWFVCVRWCTSGSSTSMPKGSLYDPWPCAIRTLASSTGTQSNWERLKSKKSRKPRVAPWSQPKAISNLVWNRALMGFQKSTRPLQPPEKYRTQAQSPCARCHRRRWAYTDARGGYRSCRIFTQKASLLATRDRLLASARNCSHCGSRTIGSIAAGRLPPIIPHGESQSFWPEK
mmetsp:Transcript_104914/g.296795  ORF Transcript_104914/g.296795 Transcript_104914/m.296795 type:complete len:387 (-) Transcript_104914:83-1243(-)